MPTDEEQLVSLAKADLATHLNIGADRISLISATELTGPDLFAGCTRKLGQPAMPDQSSKGYQIWLRAEGRNYLYHAGMPNMIVACEQAAVPTNHP